LADDFARQSCGLIVGGSGAQFEMLLRELSKGFGLRAVISNSVENQHLTHWVNAAGLPLVSLIHEFSEYTFPVSKSTAAVRLSDRVIVPAHLVEESIQREVQSICSTRAPNIVVRHQGALPYLPKQRGASAAALSAEEIRELVAGLGLGQRHIVLGAGHAQPRKGVDLFVQTAGYVARQRADVAFVWVGSGYHPKTDLQYSLWVDQTIERMGLRKTVLFLPSQPSLDACFEASDLFYLPSRLDPYPNVVIDALMASRDVVCFDGATGCAELFGEDVGFRGAAVPYADVQAAGDAIIRLIDESPKDDFNAVKAAEYFDFDAYLAAIETEIEAACANAAVNEAQAQRLIDKGLIDREYYSPHARNAAMAVRDYVASSRKGLAPRNPRPGFSENWWRSLHPGKDGTCPLIAELDAGNERPRTHRCDILSKSAPRAAGSLRVALHLHLHFSELAEEFARRLSLADVPLDLFATVTNGKAVQAVEHAFADYEHGTVQTLLVPNRGRDIGPLLVDLREPLKGYDIVGHLHGKRSLDVGGDVGARWFSFLADTLIGSDNGVFGQIIGKFEKQPGLGLVFAEDAHNVGWSDNRPFAEKLAERTKPKLDLPSHPFFPLGTMFWARHEALRPLWNANITQDELPIEPLPYDGSVLHALERMLPTSCQAAGLEWQTVMIPGLSW
jgi:glycosyltransferase involved in cell wall biosynthesis